jgi:hypothetical protein
MSVKSPSPQDPFPAQPQQTTPETGSTPASGDVAEQIEALAPPPPAKSVRDYLLYSLSLPERAVRSTAGLAGGALREATELLVPAAFQDSKTYSTLVRQTLDFLVEDVGGVQREEGDDAPAKVEGFVARKAVGNFVELAGMATLHVSPLMLLAVVSDVAYGSQTYLKELADELKREGVIDEDSTINHAGDLLDAVRQASGTAATTFDTPPLSIEGLRESINQTRDAALRIDPTKVLPKAEINRMWEEMRTIASEENVSLFEVSSAMTLHSLDKVATVGRGALSGVRAAGTLLDRHVLDHYRQSLTEIHTKGYYATLAEASGPYIEAVWQNFSTTKSTITEDLLSGKLLGEAAQGVKKWWSKPDGSE